ncbi:MAG: phenylacetate--CoA ligase family protein [Deltaproteobacteria bacterium]|nr:phenylacetate--CoA ligase family protein [Deltaproteobacteria bacterium]
MRDLSMFNAEMEALSPADQDRVERERLPRQLEHVFARSRMVRDKLSAAGLDPDPSRFGDPDRLAELPFITKTDLRASQEREPPFGDFLAVSPEAVQRVHRTSGTTGRFVYTALTRNDLAVTHDCGARAFWSAGLRPHHRVIHCLNYCLWMGGYTDHANLENTGATVFPYGVGNSRQLVRVIREAGIDTISSTPSYPNVLEGVVREELDIEPRDLGLRLGLFGGEPGLDDPNVRQRIEATWGLTVRNANYGVSDLLCNFAAQCEENPDLHFLGQGALLARLIEPHEEGDVPVREGAVGEMVLTHLQKEAQPLVRYRTSDILEITGTGPCRCGRTGFRFRVVGRSDDMLHVRGINVFPGGIARVLEPLLPEVTGEFQIVVNHPSPYTQLDVAVEQGPAAAPEDAAALARRVEAGVKDALGITVRVDLVPAGSIQRTDTGKVRRVLKTY